MVIGSTFVKNMSCLYPHSLEKLGATIFVKRFVNTVHSTKKNMCSNSEGDASIGKLGNLLRNAKLLFLFLDNLWLKFNK